MKESLNLETLIPFYTRKVEHTRHKVSRITNERFYYDYARTQEQIREVFALRYKVFCVEKKFIPHHFYPDQQQTDEFDFLGSTKHVVAFCSGKSGSICGTMRAIRDPKNPLFESSQDLISDGKISGLPIEYYYPLDKFRQQGKRIQQLTGLAFTKGIREQMYLGLCKSVYLDAIAHEIDDVFIQANPFMAWLFTAMGFKELYSSWHSIGSGPTSDTEKPIPVIGMHLDMTKITREFESYFNSPSPHFLFLNT